MLSESVKMSMREAAPGTGGGASTAAFSDRGEESRAEIYVLLAQLLYAPPTQQLLEAIAGLKGDDTEFGRAVSMLAEAAGKTSLDEAELEFENLFVGVPTALLMPYASYYLAGSLFGRPLAKLRIDMVRLGISRREKTTEPEDHIGPLCEMMAGLIMGSFGEGRASLGVQRLFFEKHISEWVPNFFSDLAAAEPAELYRYVARLGSLFVEIESRAFKMVG
jgi:TorA maturation chaperone TorD